MAREKQSTYYHTYMAFKRVEIHVVLRKMCIERKDNPKLKPKEPQHLELGGAQVTQ